jgi:hypothetical protein
MTTRWEILKKSYALAKKAFPKAKSLYVEMPPKIGLQGSCRIFDLGNPDAPMGAAEYKTCFSSGTPYVSVSVSGNEEKVEVKKAASSEVPVSSVPHKLGQKAPDEKKRPQQGRKFKDYEKVRVKDSASMEYQEAGQVLDCKGSYGKGYWYLVLVDGSSKPQWFAEEDLKPIGF